jgi:hypothetical protein
MVEYGKILANALKFSVSPSRWIPLFSLDTIAFTVLAFYFLLNFRTIMIFSEGSQFVAPLLSMILVFGVIYVFWILARIYIIGALIHQSVKPKEYKKSWKISRKRYFSMIMVAIIVGVISTLVGMVPYVGWIFSIIVSLVFLFSMTAVILDGKPFDKALSISYKIFRKKKVEVFIVWLLIAIISSLIIFIFAVPLIFAFVIKLLPLFMGLSETAGVFEFFSIIISNAMVLIPGVVIMLVGIGVSQIFTINAQAHFYLKLKKGVK